MKRKLILLAVLTLLVAILAVSVSAETVAGGECGDNLTWTLDDAGTLTISGSGEMNSYGYYYNYSYHGDAPWKSYLSSIKQVHIEGNVTSIGNGAFVYCRNLTSVTIPDSVTTIGAYAFYDCSGLTNVIVGDGVTSIGNYAFEDCSSLTSVTIGDSVTSIGYGVFKYCSSLTSVTIPDGITSIGNGAFYSCSSLQYNSYDNGKYLGNANNPYVALIKTTSSVITSCVIHTDTKLIGPDAFEYCDDLTSLTIPDGIQRVQALPNINSLQCNSYDNGEYLGNANNPYVVLVKAKTESITSCTIHEDTKVIYDDAFRNCHDVTTITIPDSVISIGGGAFFECDNLTGVTIGDSVQNIGSSAFSHNRCLVWVTIGGNVQTIEDSAFFYCSNLRHISYAGTREQWSSISVGEDNPNLTRKIEHFQVEDEPVSWKKNCRNQGQFCSLCNDFIIKENATDGVHAYTDKSDISCNDCDFVQHAAEIRIGTFPQKRRFILFNEKVDVTGGKLTVYYDDGADNQIIDITEDMISGFDNTKLGPATLTVTYQGKTAAYDIYVDTVCSVVVDSSEYPQSSHNYAANTDETKTYTANGAYALVLTFSSDTETEGSDYIYIYDGQDNEIAKYSGTQAAEQTVIVSGDTFKVRLTSDDAINKYGYSFDSIVVKRTAHTGVNGVCSSCGEKLLNGLVQQGGKWNYYKDGVHQTGYTGLAKHSSGTYYYVQNGTINWNYTGVTLYGNTTYYIQKGKLVWGVNGLKQIGSKWYYLKNSVVQTGYTGLVKHTSGTFYYVQKGVINFSYTGVTLYGNATYYVQKGKLVWGVNGLKQIGSTWYYLKNSVVQTGFNGVVQHTTGTWYYVQKGQISFGYTGLAKHTNGTYYYIQKGQIKWNYTGVTLYGNTTYYVQKGKLVWGVNGLKQVGDTWYYLKNSVVQTGYTGLVQHANGTWYYVQKGQINFGYTGLVSHTSKLYYVEKGRITWKYNGTATYGGKTYNVVNSRAQ